MKKEEENQEISDYSSMAYFNHYQRMVMTENKRKKIYKIFLPFVIIFVLTLFAVIFVYPHL